MKKIFVLGFAFVLFTVAASAQKGQDALHRDQDHFRTGQLTRGEKFKMRKEDGKYKRTNRKFKHDGHLNRYEKRKLHGMRKHDRRKTFRYKHNSHRRVM